MGKIFKTELKKDYWFSEKMIKEMLPEPEKKYCGYGKYATLWNQSDVFMAMQTDRYKEHIEKARKRKAKGREIAEQKRLANVKKIEDIAELLEFWDIPTDKDELLDDAVFHYNIIQGAHYKGDWEYSYKPAKSFSQAKQERIMFNYIRHSCSNYDRLIKIADKKIEGQNGHKKFYDVLQKALYDKFKEKLESDYPYLLDALEIWKKEGIKKSEAEDEIESRCRTIWGTGYECNPKIMRNPYDFSRFEIKPALERDDLLRKAVIYKRITESRKAAVDPKYGSMKIINMADDFTPGTETGNQWSLEYLLDEHSNFNKILQDNPKDNYLYVDFAKQVRKIIEADYPYLLEAFDNL